MKRPELDYSNPVPFTLRQRITLTIVSHFVALLMRVICGTCRVEIRNPQHLMQAQQGDSAALLLFWHEVIPLAAWRYRGSGIHTLTSYSYDGELVARVVGHLGIGALRGSSSRGGSDAMHRMSMALSQGVSVIFTPDGPRGPRRELKAGAAVLSARTKMPVIPNAFAATRCWRMKSWDRMVIPKPFSTIVCEYGEPVAACESEDEAAIEAKRAELERTMVALQERLDREVSRAVS